MAPLQQWVIHSLHTGLCTGYTQQTQSYPQVIHLKSKVIHNLSTVNLDLHRSYPQFINSLYSIILIGWLIELIAVYTVESIVYPKAPIYTVYIEYSSDPTVLLQYTQSLVLTVCAVTMWESVSRFSQTRLDRQWAQAESLKTPEKVWKSAIKCDGSAHMSHLKAEPYRSTVVPRV